MAHETEPDVTVSWSSLTVILGAARSVPQSKALKQAIANCEKWMSEAALLEELKEDDR